MSQNSFLFSLSLFALLTACAGQMPKTHDEFRSQLQQHPNMMGVRIEKFEVDRPMPQTAQFVKKKSDECLNHTIRVTSSTSSGGMLTSFSDSLVKYQPRANISAAKATVYTTELYMNIKGEPMQEPYYTFVADFIPVTKKKTKVELYYIWGEPRPLVAKAIKAWATGTDVGCPNLSKR